jgi:hypothetical protein
LNFTGFLSSPGIAGEEAVTAETDCAAMVELIATVKTAADTMLNIRALFIRARSRNPFVFIK